ncbi:MAG: hypothetical protein SH817_14730 [Leptospira sp.]|nr:hypothetical protein [Leptospira sp.]
MFNYIRNLFLILILLLISGCIKYKDSSFDQNGELATLLNLQRLLGFSQTTTISLKLKFTSNNGNAYSDYYTLSTFPSSEAPALTATANTRFTAGTNETTTTLNSTGEGVFNFTQPGFVKITIYESKSSTIAKGSIVFRVFPTLSQSNFKIISQNGDLMVSAISVSPYNIAFNNFPDSFFSPLGTYNNRFYGTLLVGAKDSDSTIYIVSTSDGINFDRITKITNLVGKIPSVSTGTQIDITLSEPNKDNSKLYFLIRRQTIVNSALESTNAHYILMDETNPEKEVTAISMPSIHGKIVTTPQFFPSIFYGGRYLVFEQDSDTLYDTPYMRSLDGTTSTNIFDSCKSGATTVQMRQTFVKNYVLYCGMDNLGSNPGTYKAVNTSFSSVSGNLDTASVALRSQLFPYADTTADGLAFFKGSSASITMHKVTIPSDFGSGGLIGDTGSSGGFTYAPSSGVSTSNFSKFLKSNSYQYILLNNTTDTSNPYTVYHSANSGTSYVAITRISTDYGDNTSFIPQGFFMLGDNFYYANNFTSATQQSGVRLTKFKPNLSNWTEASKATFSQSN